MRYHRRPPSFPEPTQRAGILIMKVERVVRVPVPVPIMPDTSAIFDRMLPLLERALQPSPPQREVLHDEAGRAYERIGNMVRPLKALSAPQGPPARTLFQDPGVPCEVPWADFKSVLEPLLEGAQRPADRQRVPCCLQVYEALIPQHVEALAQAVLGDARLSVQLHPLTAAAAGQLGITLSPSPAQAGPRVRRMPGVLFPQERVFRLQLVSPAASTAPAEEQAQKEQVASAQKFTVRPRKWRVPAP